MTVSGGGVRRRSYSFTAPGLLTKTSCSVETTIIHVFIYVLLSLYVERRCDVITETHMAERIEHFQKHNSTTLFHLPVGFVGW